MDTVKVYRPKVREFLKDVRIMGYLIWVIDER